MSSDATQSPLARAYDLVEAGRYDEARALLEPILASDFDNADAWWIYAHAVTDAALGRDALENVLRIDPNYPGATELLQQAETMAAPKPKITPIAPATVPEAPDAALEDEDFSEFETEAPSAAARKATISPAQRRSAFPLIAVVAVIVIALVLIVLLLQTGGTPVATATRAAVLATSTESGAAVVTGEATQSASPMEATPEALPTAAPTTAATVETTIAAEQTSEAAGIDLAALETALAEFPIAESGIGVVDTSLGSTLMVSACTEAGRAMRTLLPQVMNALAMQSAAFGSDIQAVGARMLDCTENTSFVTVATELATAQSYAQGGMSDSDFAATWKPQ
jgi:hypothetical protein